MPRLLIANRGEIAVRILRSARRLGYTTVALHASDDADGLVTRLADESIDLGQTGVAAYLNVDNIVALCGAMQIDLVHPGYGFLAENAQFASALEAAGITFVGPSPATLEQLGDKVAAKALARTHSVPVIPDWTDGSDLDQVRAFFDREGPILLKAVAGGGGRGMRVVATADELQPALERAASEARRAFGDDRVYAEKYLSAPQHVEVQVIGDGTRAVALGDRECSLQRRHQKLVEFAPALMVDAALRQQMRAAAERIASAIGYRGLGTFEFLVSAGRYYFIEANPRIQVEHTVTEATTGLDLIAAQLKVAGGAQLAAITPIAAYLEAPPAPQGVAVQLRVCLESLTDSGSWVPATGMLTRYEPPTGHGIRVDSAGFTGLTAQAGFDSLLAKVIVTAEDYPELLAAADAALTEFVLEGVDSNLPLLRAILDLPQVQAGTADTQTIEAAADALRAQVAVLAAAPATYASADKSSNATASGRAGAGIDSRDPLAVLDYGKEGGTATAAPAPVRDAPEGHSWVPAPMQGTVLELSVAVGDTVAAGSQLAIMDAMKMEHVIGAPAAGTVRQIDVASGQAIVADHPLVLLELDAAAGAAEITVEQVDPDHIRPDLQEALDRHAIGLDPARPDAVARRRKTGHTTARENLAALVDADSYVEYGPLVIAAQRRRRTLEDLIEKTPADGMIAGVGSINGEMFPNANTQCAVLSYDYTVLAGTQGGQNHRKKDRLFEIALEHQLPVVFFTEGGGGRPGDTDGIGGAGLDCLAFMYFGQLSGRVPLVGIVSGRCFAGNAALLGCCDVVIATEGSNIGMGGPAMIEGGGLGIFRPEEIGPLDVQRQNGVVDLAVQDYPEAIAVAKQYLSYFQGRTAGASVPDQRLLRHVIPENRLRVYDIRRVIELLADEDSVLELRRDFGLGMITAFARIDGRPIGIIANNPAHLSGAIDSDGADKAARFLKLCDAFGIPVLFLCDTPGIMVGPEVEKTALVRHAARLFVVGGSISVPFFTIILRKGYGLGAQAMAGGSFKAPFFTVAWPTGEFGGMGLEGAVKLGFRNELAAIDDPDERAAKFDEMVERMYERGKAVSTASYFEIDDVIDPADSRRWITMALDATEDKFSAGGGRRPCVDTW
ncbi:MAG: carboxyl transferase domain-containing protein [Pseudomonadota bacterium]